MKRLIIFIFILSCSTSKKNIHKEDKARVIKHEVKINCDLTFNKLCEINSILKINDNIKISSPIEKKKENILNLPSLIKGGLKK